MPTLSYNPNELEKLPRDSMYLKPGFYERMLAGANHVFAGAPMTPEKIKDLVFEQLGPRCRSVYHARTKAKRDKTPKIMLTDELADYDFGSALFEREDVLKVCDDDGTKRGFDDPRVHKHAAIRPIPGWLRLLSASLSAQFECKFNHIIAIRSVCRGSRLAHSPLTRSPSRLQVQGRDQLHAVAPGRGA